MAEYIEREAALLEIEEWADTFCECDYVWPHVIKSIRNLPAADVRPVISCGECKHWETDWTPRSVSDGRHYCAPLDLFPSADWYCSDGERMEES